MAQHDLLRPRVTVDGQPVLAVRLQEVGLVPGIPTENITAGMDTVWNFGSVYNVKSIIKVAPKTYEAVLVGPKGVEYKKRLRAGRLVPVTVTTYRAYAGKK